MRRRRHAFRARVEESIRKSRRKEERVSSFVGNGKSKFWLAHHERTQPAGHAQVPNTSTELSGSIRKIVGDCRELVGINGFGQVMIESRLERAPAVVILPPTGEGDQLEIRGPGFVP